MRKLLFVIPMAVVACAMGCSHGYVGVGVHEDRGFYGDRYYGHHEWAYRRPVVVEPRRPVIIHDGHHDGHDGRFAGDRW
jgi:hypothetical protein